MTTKQEKLNVIRGHYEAWTFEDLLYEASKFPKEIIRNRNIDNSTDVIDAIMDELKSDDAVVDSFYKSIAS